MPPLSELEEYLRVLRVCYANRAAAPEAVSGGRFARMLAVVAGLDKAPAVLRGFEAVLGQVTPAGVMALPRARLEQALRPAGFSGAKAGGLANLLEFLADKAAGEQLNDPTLSFLDADDTAGLRAELLQVRGLGPESVDAVLLLALERPVFPVNAGIWRLLRRHGFVGEEAEYAEMQQMFTAILPEDVALYRECFLALRGVTGEFCRARPVCSSCPLGAYLEYELCE